MEQADLYGPLRGQRVELIDDRQDAGAERNLLALEPARIPAAVPSLVMRQDERRDRIRKRHGSDDLRADLRMRPDLLELLGVSGPGFERMCSGTASLPMSCSTAAVRTACTSASDIPSITASSPGIRLHAPHVCRRRHVFRVDRDGERFDRREVQVGHLLRPALLGLDPLRPRAAGHVRQHQRQKCGRPQPPCRSMDEHCRNRARPRAHAAAQRDPRQLVAPGRRGVPARRGEQTAAHHERAQEHPDERGHDDRQLETVERRGVRERHTARDGVHTAGGERDRHER